MENETNPVDEPEVDDVAIDTDTDVSEDVELDENGNPVEADDADAEPDYEDVDVDGVTHRIPKALKGQFLMQQDYTRKTQELAEQRRAFDAHRETFGRLSQQELSAQAKVMAIDEAIAEYKSIDWSAWQQRDPQRAQRAFTEYQLLKDQRGDAVNLYTQAQGQRTAQEQQATAERLRQGMDQLARDIPGWGQEKATALLDFGHKQLGFSREELAAIDDPRMIVALNLAFEAQGSKRKQQVASSVAKQQAVKPASKVTAGRTPGRSLDDRTSTDAWMKARQAQLTKR